MSHVSSRESRLAIQAALYVHEVAVSVSEVDSLDLRRFLCGCWSPACTFALQRQQKKKKQELK